MTRTAKACTILLASTAIALSAAGNAAARSGNGSAPVHGPGSSHNPIVYHPVHGPGSSHNPIVATKPVVRDHRNPGRRGPYGGGRYGGNSSAQGGVTVTSGSGRNKVVVPTQVGDGGRVYAVPGRGLYNPPTPIVLDHR